MGGHTCVHLPRTAAGKHSEYFEATIGSCMGCLLQAGRHFEHLLVMMGSCRGIYNSEC